MYDLYTFEVVESYNPFLQRASYGILAKKLEDGLVREAAFIPGISCNRDFVLRLLSRCERNQFSPIYLLDIVTDALS